MRINENEKELVRRHPVLIFIMLVFYTPIKRHPILMIFVICLVTLITTWNVLTNMRFCFSERRWVDNNEKLFRAMDVVNNLERHYIDAGSDSGYYKKIKYTDISDIFKRNPNCCHYNVELHNVTYQYKTEFYRDDSHENLIMDGIIKGSISLNNCGFLDNDFVFENSFSKPR